MIIPIRVYGDPILREVTEDVTSDSPELQELIDNMLETMRAAEGIGLAAPQIGRHERIFVVDLTPTCDTPEELTQLPAQPMVFINPAIVWESESESEFEEGCLSIPEIRDIVVRPDRIRMTYLDREFRSREIEVGEMLARVFQHEYDHLEGVLFIDHITPFRRRLLRRRLREIASGDVEAEYPLHPNVT
ncbi:MAG: peptide deformylase [Rhodothermales bacterium]